ncbi:ABC transporter permease [Streptococcus didelphis]|uniref:ABC transporter permease n=2 Tax=Streptococcus didelphis TaxID=102886 RepID=A0ABY9LIW5_9STRE|nr:ABC-2 family transporter protein [Streptococcus didelphis]WMB28728.1 ABC transporter permease [Streptococcus didelphis]
MLTYCIPLALVQYYPFLYLIGKSSDKRLLILPILAQLFVLPVYLVWKIGLNNYQSTGS